MELREQVSQSVKAAHQSVVRLTSGLTPTQLRWQPDNATNLAVFLVLHLYRTLDRQCHCQLSPQGELWERNKWNRHFVLPPEPATAHEAWSTGNGWTMQEVISFQAPIDELLAYGDSVVQSALRKVATLDISDLNRVAGSGPNTVGYLLERVQLHPQEHIPEIEALVAAMRQLGIK